MEKSLVSHCLQCKNAMCQKHCPINTNIPLVIKLFLEDNKSEAGSILFENNPLSAICAIVCDHQKQCFGHCILNHKDNPVPFYLVERDLSLWYLHNLHYNKLPHSKKIAIVGAGPAGIVAAIKLAEKGFKVDIYDNHPKIGGVLRYGIPDFRLPKIYLDEYERILKELDVNFFNNITFNKDLQLDFIKKNYTATILCFGTWEPKRLGIPISTENSVIYGIDFLENHNQLNKNGTAIVLGGGNVAMDAARTAKSLGYDTSIYYRKEIMDMPASQEEIKSVISDGIKINILSTPKEITPSGIVFYKCETVVGEDGKKYSKTIEDSEYFVNCDLIIPAISQESSITKLEGIEFENKLIKVDSNFETYKQNVFACGDIVNGPSTVVSASLQGKIVAEIIIKRFL